MGYRSLPDFLEELGQAGELTRVSAAVTPLLELAEITGRVSKAHGNALLFGGIRGYDTPIVTNLLGTEARICRALGVGSLADATRRVALLVSSDTPEGWFERLRTAPHDAMLRKSSPRSVKTGVCQQVVRLGSDVDLDQLPVPQSMPGEAGRMITAGLVFTADPETGRVVGRYDLQVLDRNRLAACWSDHDEPARLLGFRHRAQEPMPVAVVLGGDPVNLLAAAAPLTPGFDVCTLAGYLRDKPLELVRCRSIDLEVPADAEFVIEGYIDRSEPQVPTGPRCGPLGMYTAAQTGPVIHVTAITHRANPVFPAIIASRPPNEACEVGRAMWQVMLPLVRMSIPDLVDVELPTFGAVRHWAMVSIRKTYAGQARRVAHAIWGLPAMMFAKFLVIVDDDVNVHDPAQIGEAVAAHAAPGRDVFFNQGPPDPLDPTASNLLTERLAIDATAKRPGECASTTPGRAEMSAEIRKLVEDRWQEYGVGRIGD
jgi:4-hydroxy-3-polyprenylbenzoate decarboxylase